MFYGRYRIRLFAETLRCYAERKEEPLAARGSSQAGGIEPVPMEYGKIGPDHILAIMYRELFEAPDAFVNLNPLSQDGKEYWGVLVDTSGRKPSAAWKLAAQFADWLDRVYQRKDPLQFEDATCSVLLNGQLYSRLRPESYAILKYLASREREYVPADAIIEALRSGGPGVGRADDPSCTQFKNKFPQGPTGRKRVSRAIDYLPPGLRELIDGLEGRGRRLVLTQP